jgi:hypothetical protein
VRRKLHVADALAKGPWTALVRRPAAVAVVVAVVAPPASSIVMVARAVVVVVVDALSPSSGLEGVLHVAVGPEAAPDRRYCGSTAPPRALDAGKEAGSGRVWTALLPARAPSVGVRLSSPLVAPPPPRAAPSVTGTLVAPRRSPPPDNHAAAWPPARFCDARLKSGGALALASMFAPSLARRLLWRVGPRAGGIGARARSCSAPGRRSRRSPFPSRGSSCTGISCAGRRSWGSASIPSSW